ncbi:MAG: esterase family protein [Candidatus Eremiobacteraeota bacterium]|nr:esterase family protein [Candidatus Eremiobacteraeota bacterium]
MTTQRFERLDLSAPLAEVDGLRFITVRSDALRRRADISVFVPPGRVIANDAPAALVVLLHGVYGSHWNWALHGGAHTTLSTLVRAGTVPPFVLAMPSDGLFGDGSGYVPRLDGDYERWIVDDVPAAVAQAFPELALERVPVCIAGLSMGGFGALRLGAKYPERFAAISGHSSITNVEALTAFVAEPLPATLRAAAGTEFDCGYWLIANRDRLPPVRFDCGDEDPLLAGNRALHARLVAAGVAHNYAEFPGGHEWAYWRRHLTDTYRFFADALTRTTRPSTSSG